MPHAKTGGGGILGLGAPSLEDPTKGTLAAWSKSQFKVPLTASGAQSNALVQASIRPDEDLEDATATTLIGPLYASIWLVRNGEALHLDHGRVWGGYGQFRSIVGILGNVSFNPGDYCIVALENKSASPISYRCDFAVGSSIGPDLFDRLSTMRSSEQGTRTMVMGLLDQDPVDLMAALDRSLLVRAPPWWGWYPHGLTYLEDDLEKLSAATQRYEVFGDAGGAVAKDTTTTRFGTNSLKITPVGGAGKFYGAKVNLPLMGDQQGHQAPAYGVFEWDWSEWGDTHWRDVQLQIENDDTVQRWVAAIKYKRRAAGATTNGLYYWDDTGNWVKIVDITLAGDKYQWHKLAMLVGYQQGASPGTGYLKYIRGRMDDYAFDLAGVSAQAVATSENQISRYGIVVTGDDATAPNVYAGPVRIGLGASMGV